MGVCLTVCVSSEMQMALALGMIQQLQLQCDAQ
jgi:hypothetical protein